MPIRKVRGGWQYGDQKVFPTKAQAEAQAKAIYASGWVEKKKKIPKIKVDQCLECWEAYAKKGNTYRLRMKMRAFYKNLWQEMAI